MSDVQTAFFVSIGLIAGGAFLIWLGRKIPPREDAEQRVNAHEKDPIVYRAQLLLAKEDDKLPDLRESVLVPGWVFFGTGIVMLCMMMKDYFAGH